MHTTDSRTSVGGCHARHSWLLLDEWAHLWMNGPWLSNVFLAHLSLHIPNRLLSQLMYTHLSISPPFSLTKALGVQLSSNRADPGLPSLTLLQLHIKLLLKINDIQPCSRGTRDALTPQLALLCPLPADAGRLCRILFFWLRDALPWWENGVENLFRLLVLLHIQGWKLVFRRRGDGTTTAESGNVSLLVVLHLLRL